MSLYVEVGGAIPRPIRSSVPRLTARAEPDQRIMKVALSVFATIACFALTPPPVAIILSAVIIVSIFFINWNEGTPRVRSDFPRHSDGDAPRANTQMWYTNPLRGGYLGESPSFLPGRHVPVGGDASSGGFELGAPEPSRGPRTSATGYSHRSTTPPPQRTLPLYSSPVRGERRQGDLPSAPPLSSGRRSELPLGAPEPRGSLPFARENDSGARDSTSSGQRRDSSTVGRTHVPVGGDASIGLPLGSPEPRGRLPLARRDDSGPEGPTSSGQRRTYSTSGRTHVPVGGNASSDLRLGAPGGGVSEAPPRAASGAPRERVKVGSGNGFVGNPDE